MHRALGLLAALAAGPARAANRLVAEWEPAKGTLVTWGAEWDRSPLGVPKGLVVELARDDTLFLLVGSASAEEAARTALHADGVNLTNVEFLRVPTNSKYTRDWGPESVEFEDGVVGLLDQRFDGNPLCCGCDDCPNATHHGHHHSCRMYGGRRDGEEHRRRRHELNNAANAKITDQLNLRRLDAKGFFFTGGNMLTDGAGTGFSTRVMVRENAAKAGLSEEEFMARVVQATGVTQYVIVDNPGFTSIQHLDCYATFADQETIVVKQVAEDHPEYECVEALAAKMGATRSLVTGMPFRIVRVLCGTTNAGDYNDHPVASYTNSFILNGNKPKVLVPLFDISSDEGAIETFKHAFPAYEVIGFPFPESYGRWYAEDALHCRTKAIYRQP